MAFNFFHRNGIDPEPFPLPEIDLGKVTKVTPLLDNDKVWEHRYYECAKQLLLQYVRSVVLGKMKGSPRELARKSRVQAYEFIKEMRKNHETQNNDNT